MSARIDAFEGIWLRRPLGMWSQRRYPAGCLHYTLKIVRNLATPGSVDHHRGDGVKGKIYRLLVFPLNSEIKRIAQSPYVLLEMLAHADAMREGCQSDSH